MKHHQTACFVLRSPDSPPSRLLESTRQLKDAAIPFEVVTGFGSGSPQVDPHRQSLLNLVYFKRSLTGGEIATALGHRRIWQAVVDRGLPHALVLEDDFLIVDKDMLGKAVSAAEALVADWEIVKLFEFKQRLNPVARTTLNEIEFVFHERPSSGMVAYVISRRACARLLARTDIYVPIDEEIRFCFRDKLRVCATRQNVVEDNGANLGGSMLESERVAIKRKRKVLRSIWGNVLSLYLKFGSKRWAGQILSDMGSGRLAHDWVI